MKDGYLDLLPSDETYWGELSREEAVQLTNESRRIGYRLACFNHFKNHPRQDLFEYILNNRGRSAFINFIYKKSRSGRCLDLGSGMGSIPSALSKLFKEVYSIELVRERVEFQTLRKRQDNIKNWTIIKGNTNRLPFPDSYFDFVSANGMLEWAAIANFSDMPRNVQLDFLKEIKRVLKPDGICYIGIENRTSISYLRGALDHSGIQYTSLMPRFIANLVSKFKAKKDNFFFEQSGTSKGNKYYRTYTYSRWGYKKLLRTIDIKNMRIFHTGFSYNLAYAGIDDETVRAVPQGVDVLKDKLTQFKHSTNRFKAWFFSLLTPNFLIFFSKNNEPIHSDFEERIVATFKDIGPFYVYRGFNNLLAYSFGSEWFYKIPAIDSSNDITQEPKAAGRSPESINLALFQKTLQELKDKYHTKVDSRPETLLRLHDMIIAQAEQYNLEPELAKEYAEAVVNKYKKEPIFSRNHGDVWQGNIFVEKNSVNLIDEENDSFNILPIELMRFALSICGYTNERGELDKYVSAVKKIYAGIADEQMLRDFYIASLFYELCRFDINSDCTKPSVFYFASAIQRALRETSLEKTLQQKYS